MEVAGERLRLVRRPARLVCELLGDLRHAEPVADGARDVVDRDEHELPFGATTRPATAAAWAAASEPSTPQRTRSKTSVRVFTPRAFHRPPPTRIGVGPESECGHVPMRIDRTRVTLDETSRGGFT